MLEQYSTILRRLTIALDAFLVSACFFISYWVRDHFKAGLENVGFYIKLWPVIVTLWVAALFILGMYESLRLKTFRQVLETIIKAMLMAFIWFSAAMYLFKIVGVSRTFMLFVFSLSTLVLIVEKFILMFALHHIRRRGFNFKNVLIVGTNNRAKRFIRRLDYHRDLGLKVVGIVDEDPSFKGQNIYGHPVLGTPQDLPEVLTQQAIDQVFFIIPRSSLQKIEPLIHHCEITGTTASVAVDLFDPLKFARWKEESIVNLPLITFRTVPDKVGQLLFKRMIDIAVSTIALIIISPVYLLVALLIKMTSPGPVYFIQERLGLQGRKFKLYKFRTMMVNAEHQLKDLLEKNEMQGPVFKLKNDPRITAIGRFLRKFSIDELPQLWNVLHGDMSLVGPRPPIAREVELYDHWQRRRLSMRPGLTCLWQVNGRNKIVNFDEWAQLDLDYIDNWSLGLDLRILMQTLRTVASGNGA